MTDIREKDLEKAVGGLHMMKPDVWDSYGENLIPADKNGWCENFGTVSSLGGNTCENCIHFFRAPDKKDYCNVQIPTVPGSR